MYSPTYSHSEKSSTKYISPTSIISASSKVQHNKYNISNKYIYQPVQGWWQPVKVEDNQCLLLCATLQRSEKLVPTQALKY